MIVFYVKKEIIFHQQSIILISNFPYSLIIFHRSTQLINLDFHFTHSHILQSKINWTIFIFNLITISSRMEVQINIMSHSKN